MYLLSGNSNNINVFAKRIQLPVYIAELIKNQISNCTTREKREKLFEGKPVRCTGYLVDYFLESPLRNVDLTPGIRH